MTEFKITNRQELEIVARSLISHAIHCQKTLQMDRETKDESGEPAITQTALRAKKELAAALAMLVKYFDTDLANSKFYCLDCLPVEGEEHERMAAAAFSVTNDCTNCGKSASYFVEPKIPFKQRFS